MRQILHLTSLCYYSGRHRAFPCKSSFFYHRFSKSKSKYVDEIVPTCIILWGGCHLLNCNSFIVLRQCVKIEPILWQMIGTKCVRMFFLLHYPVLCCFSISFENVFPPSSENQRCESAHVQCELTFRILHSKETCFTMYYKQCKVNYCHIVYKKKVRN